MQNMAPDWYLHGTKKISGLHQAARQGQAG